MYLSEFNLKPEDIILKGDIIGFVGSSCWNRNGKLYFT